VSAGQASSGWLNLGGEFMVLLGLRDEEARGEENKGTGENMA
jgi:hypothetical protein